MVTGEWTKNNFDGMYLYEDDLKNWFFDKRVYLKNIKTNSVKRVYEIKTRREKLTILELSLIHSYLISADNAKQDGYWVNRHKLGLFPDLGIKDLLFYVREKFNYDAKNL